MVVPLTSDVEPRPQQGTPGALLPGADCTPRPDPSCIPGCTPGWPAGGLDARGAAELAVLLRALADPVRLRLYTRIAATGGETCVCDLGDLGVSQPTVSHHLRKLREAGLIDGERRGNWVYYRALAAGLAPVRELLGAAPQTA